MTERRLTPEAEGLRRAVRWLSDNRPVTRELIDQAARRFDLSPLDAEFLRREFLSRGR
jgi:hypothetical protein